MLVATQTIEKQAWKTGIWKSRPPDPLRVSLPTMIRDTRDEHGDIQPRRSVLAHQQNISFTFSLLFMLLLLFFVKNMKKHSPLLARVLFEFITKVTFQKYVKSTKSTSKSIFKWVEVSKSSSKVEQL